MTIRGTTAAHSRRFRSKRWLRNLVAGFAVEDALVHPQHVAGGEDHADGGPDGPGEVDQSGSLQHQELAHEIVEHGQPDAGQGSDQKGCGKPGRGRGHAAVIGDLERMAALIEQADQGEQGAGGNAVVQHLVNGTVEALLGEGEDSQHHEAEMADRGIRHQLFHVGLHHGHQRAVDDADDGENDDPTGAGARGRRETWAGRNAEFRRCPSSA